jgi:hypothetical protein
MNNFNSFAELDFKTCNAANFKTMNIVPNKLLVLNDSLDFSSLKQTNRESILIFLFFPLQGINVESDVFKKVNRNPSYNSKNLHCSLVHSNFDFYHENNLIDETTCDERLLYIKKNFLSNLKILNATTKVIYPERGLCPLVFHKNKLFLHCNRQQSIHWKHFEIS